MSSSILKYGQIIRIRCNENSNAFLTSKSYTDQNLYFQVYNKNQTFPSGEAININNYRESLFQVLPTSSFQINDQMNSQKTQAKKAESAPRAKTQEQQFKAMCADKRGNNISFGEKVIFRHLDSQYYMYGSFDCASSGMGAFKIQLKKELSQKIIFRLLSFRTYEKEGDQISIYAPFKIYHCETQCFVSFCLQRLFLDNLSGYVQIGENYLQYDESFPVYPPKIKQAYFNQGQQQQQQGLQEGRNAKLILPETARFLIINENIPKRVFKLVTHNQFEYKINKQNIRNHDIVYFIHTQKDQYICPDNFTPKINLKKRLGDSDLEDIFDGLWEIQQIKTIQQKMQEGILGKSKSPSRKQPRDYIRKLGNNLLPPTGSLGMSYLTATIGGAIIDGQGQTRPPPPPNLQGEQQGQKNKKGKGSKKSKKHILRHLASGRIMYVSHDVTKVELEYFDSDKKPLLLQSNDKNFDDGSLVQFTHKTRDYNNPDKYMKFYLSTNTDSKRLKNRYQGAIQEQNEESRIGGGQDLQNPLTIAYNSRFQISELGFALDSSEHGFRIYKISQDSKQQCLFVLSSQQIISKFSKLISQYQQLQILLLDLNVFLLNNVMNVLKNLIGFIYQCDYNKIAQSGNSPNPKRQRIFDQLGMIELITRMLQQINNADFPPQQKLSKKIDSNNRIQSKKQKLKKLSQGNKYSQYRKIRTIYQLGYKLLQSVAANNDLMKIKISKYMKKYLHHIMEKVNRTVYRSIQEFLDGNYLALQLITDSYIKDLIQSFDPSDPDPADLYFLSRLCLCKQRTVPKNQNSVFNNFYKQNSSIRTIRQDLFKPFSLDQNKIANIQQTLAANKFKFREDQQKMQILSKIVPTVEAQYRTLSQLYEQCNLMRNEGGYDPDKNHWSYFMQYLNLLADVCVQRNKSPLDYINLNLPIKRLVAFLHQSTVKKNLLFQPFIRLVHHAFVQTSMYQEINRITKVKDWNELKNFEIPKAKNSIPDQIKRTRQLIENYIKRINKLPFQKKKIQQDSNLKPQPESIQFNLDDKDKLVNVKTFLQILKSTLNLGFWSEIKQMKRLVPYLLKLMKFDIQYANSVLQTTIETDKANGQNQHLNEQSYRQLVYGRIKQQLKLNKPNIVLLVECKILAAKILNIIIDYQYNVRVSMITKHFKDVMQIDADLSKYTYDKLKFINNWKNHKEYQEFAPTNQKQGYLLIQDLWMDKVVEILDTRNIFSQCQAQNINPSLVFFQAFVYSNTELTNLTLELINRITNQRQEILRTFKDIIFVAGGHLKNLAVRGVETTRSVLLSLTSPTIRDQNISNNVLWMVMRPEQQHLPQIKLGVIQQLASLTMSMMKNHANPSAKNASDFYSTTDLYPFYDITLRKLSDYQGEIADGSYCIISQKDENLILNQNLIKSQDHHLLIIDFIKIMSQLPTADALPMRALHAAYNFLTVLIWNNNDNKKQLENILKISQCHLSYNVGCIDFFKQMYTNNKKLVKKSEIKPIIQLVISHANGLPVTSYLKSKLLDFLRIAVIFDDEGYDINQNMVMQLISQYQVSSNNQIVYLKAEEQSSSSLSNSIMLSYEMWIGQYTRDYQKATYQYILNISPQLCYIATFFEVFSALIQNQNVVNIGKASNMHPIDFLLKMLMESKQCWIVIRHLRAYLNKLYYFQGRSKDTTLFKAFTFTDIPIIKEQLRGIVELIYNYPDYNSIKIANPIRYVYISSYVFLSLQQILHSLDLFFIGKGGKDYESFLGLSINQQVQDPQNEKYELTFNVLEIIEMLEYLLKTIDGRFVNKYITRVSKKLRSFMSNVPYKVVNRFAQQSKQQTNRNIEQNKISSDDIPFKKSYLFHDGKGFWRHLIDWNSFKDQEIQREKDLSKVQKRIEQNPNETKEAVQQRKRDYMLDLIYLGNIDKKIQKSKIKSKQKLIQKAKEAKQQGGKSQVALPKNLTTSQSVRFRVKNERFSSLQQKNIIINQRRKKLVKFLQINQAFSRFSKQQISQSLYDVFAKLDTTSKLYYTDTLIVGNAQVITSIVKMNEYDPQSIKSQYKLLLIRLLTNYIQRQSTIFEKDIKQWYFSKQQEAKCIRQPQNFLYECKVARFLSSLIINDLRYGIQMANAILMLGVTLLLGKNKCIQNELFKLIQQDERNLLLSEINHLIKDCGSSISAHLAGGKISEYNPNLINYSDTYDFYIDTQKIMKRRFIFEPQTVLQQKQFDQKVINMQYAFVFLKNLCQGQKEIKQYIRQQVTNDQQKKLKPQSVNFLALSVSQLRRMFTKFNIDIIKVPFSIIDFIYQVTQIPCLQNQKFICKSSWFSDFAILQTLIAGLIQKKQLQPTPQNILIIFSLYSSNIKNVISCLQGNIEIIFTSLSSDVHCKYFARVLSFYITYLPKVQNIGEITDAATLQKLLDKNKLHQHFYLDMFQVTSVIVKLQKKLMNQTIRDRINHQLKKANIQKIFQLLKKNLLGIQIRMDGGDDSSVQYQTQFFPRHKVFRYLSRTTRTTIMEQVDRSTQRDKIIGLLGTKKAINQQIQYNYKLDNQYKIFKVPFSITNAKIQYYFQLGLYISTLICFLMAWFAAVVYYPYQDVIVYDLGDQQLILNGLAIIQFLVSLMYFSLWWQTHAYLAIKKYQRQKSEPEQDGGGSEQGPVLKLLMHIPGFKTLYCLTQDGEFGNMALFMFGSAMGAFYKIQWFSILLINFLMAKMDVLKSILRAMKASVPMLSMLSFFGGSFIAFFSVFALQYYVESIYPQKHPKQHCQSVFSCIIELYIKEQINNDMQQFKGGRFTYDMIYIVFMEMLFGNIVGGVLIDNFASLRGEREEMLKDKTQKCFICGIDRQTLQKRSENLKTHYTQRYHKLWNYVFYLYYLEQQTKKTGLEEIIIKKYEQQDVSWLPVAASQQSDIGDLLSRLQKLVKEQEQSIKAIQSKS